MSIGYNRHTRRQFLIGSGGMLALPLMTSILPSYAQAATPPRRMMTFWFDHGNLDLMWPKASVATTPVGTAGVKEALLRNLGPLASIAPVLSNSRYEALKNADQITMLRGFCTAQGYGPAHGNYIMAAAAGRSSEGGFPTIDTIFETSKTLYPEAASAYVNKAIRISMIGVNAFYKRVGSQTQPMPFYSFYQVPQFYNDVFSQLTGGTVSTASNEAKSDVLNRVFSAYQSFKNNRKISSEDKARLEQHMGFIADLQKGYLATVPPMPAGCVAPPAPANDIGRDAAQSNKMYMSLLALAFKCGLTKHAVMVVDAGNSAYLPSLQGVASVQAGNGDIHGVIHGSEGTALQRTAFFDWWTYQANQIAENFLAPLSEMEGNTGRSYVQNMITGLECAGGIHGLGGDGGHNGRDSQQILIGNMGGLLRSGRYYLMPRDKDDAWRGLPLNCFLLTKLHLMGIPPSEYTWTTPDGKGIGFYGFEPGYPFQNRWYSPVSEVLTA